MDLFSKLLKYGKCKIECIVCTLYGSTLILDQMEINVTHIIGLQGIY